MPSRPPVEAPPMFTEFKNYALTIAVNAAARYPVLREDFISDALFALWKLSINGNVKPGPVKGLVAFVVNRALNERVKLTRCKHPELFRPAGPVTLDNGTEAEAVSVLADHRQAAAGVRGFEELLNLIESDDVRGLARRHFGDDVSFAELAAERGVSRNAVGQRVNAAVRKLATIVG